MCGGSPAQNHLIMSSPMSAEDGERPRTPPLDVVLRPSAALDEEEVAELFRQSWPGGGTPRFELARSLCWVSAHVGERLVGFVNVAWDGGRHAFLLDSVVHPACRRRGVGLALVRCAVEEARSLGAEWLHVDYEARHADFYRRCGFRPTRAGLIALRADTGGAERPVAGLVLRRYAAQDAEGCASVFASLPEWFVPSATAAYLADLPK